MKKIILLLALAANVFVSNATTITGTLAATNTALITSPFVLQNVTLYCTNTAPSLVYLIDGYYNKTNAAYTNYTVSISSAVTTYITTTGITNTMTNTVYKTTVNPVAASTAVGTPVITILVPASSVPISLVENVSFANRLTLSNASAGLSYFINYRAP